MIGVLVTVLVQSSSTSTSIIVSLVGAAGHLHVLALARFTVAQLNWTTVFAIFVVCYQQDLTIRPNCSDNLSVHPFYTDQFWNCPRIENDASLQFTVYELGPINFVTLTRMTNNASCNWVNLLQVSSVQFGGCEPSFRYSLNSALPRLMTFVYSPDENTAAFIYSHSRLMFHLAI